MATFDATGIILAGGEASRMNGRDKARLVLDRQKQRAYTKKHFQQPDLGNLDGLEL